MIKAAKYYTIHESRRQLKLQTLQRQQTNEREQPVPGLGKKLRLKIVWMPKVNPKIRAMHIKSSQKQK